MTMTTPPNDTPTRQIYRDDLGRVFDRMQLQRGESFDFAMGLREVGAPDFQWQWYSHIDFDGIGALAHITKQCGHDLAPPQLKIRPARRATTREYLKPFLRPAYLRAAPRCSWHAAAVPPAPARQIPEHGIQLSADETLAVTQLAHHLGVTVSSLVLWALADAVRPHTRRPSDPQYWTLPVNMRGGAGLPSTAANILSFVRVMVRPGDTPATIHARFYDLLETGMHWVMLGWIRFFANRSRLAFPPVRSTGCLSNLGSYTVPGVERVMFTPPPATTEPIAAGVVSINGMMTLALATHHSLSPAPGALDDVATRWRARLLGDRDAS